MIKENGPREDGDNAEINLDFFSINQTCSIVQGMIIL